VASSNVTRTAPSTRSAVVVLTLLAALLGAQLSAPLAATADETADAATTSESAAAADRAAALLECTITGTRGDDVLVGGRGDDVLCGGGGDDVLRGGGGDDVLRGGGGEDRLFGGSGDDYLMGGRADDRLRAGAGDDDLRGGRGNDRLHARDADRFEDDLRCAEGREDRAFADAGDFVSRTCEEPPRNAAPTDLMLSPASVVENAVVGTEVGLLSVTDPDERDTHTFTVVAGAGDADNASFAIDGRRLVTAAALDFERDAALTLRVRVTDRAGAAYDEVVEVAVVDVAENPPPVAVDDTFSTDEDTVLALPTSGPGGPAANDVDTDPLAVTDVAGATGGTVALAGGTVRFTPAADRCGPGAGGFGYTVSDGRGGTDVGRVTVDVTCVPDDPRATDDTVTVTEDDAATAVPVLANDTDVEGDELEIGSVTQPADGTVVITGGGSGLTYEPDADHCSSGAGGSPDTFTYSLAPGGSTAEVSVTVTCVDDAPVAVDDATTVVEDAAAGAIDVLANDTDVDAGELAVRSVTQPGDGTVVITGGGTGVTYAPDADSCTSGGTPDTFTYTLNGGSTATVGVTVTCVDDAPVAVDDATTVVEDSAATAIDVLDNDTDVDGGTTSIASVTQPANGTVVVTGGGTGLTYVPDANYCNAPGGGVPDAAADTFTYVLDGGSTGTVRVTVTCVDDRPVAVDDAATTDEDEQVDVAVLANDTDVDGGARAVASVTQPADGTVTITGGGSGVRYVPDADACGPDSFTYELNGGTSATVSVTVTCVDDAPVAVADTSSVPVDGPATAIDVLANDTDVDGGALSVTTATQPTNGTVVVTGGGTGLTYEPDAGYCNSVTGGTPDTFSYTLNGGSIATVSVTVVCDTPPVAVADVATVVEDAAATEIDVLANDTDTDGGPKVVVSVTDADHGTTAFTEDGVTYAPDADYCNSTAGGTPDSFTYEVNGGFTATVSVTVTCVDDDPVAVDDAATVLEDAAAGAVDVLGNDTDVDGGPVAISALTQPVNGTVAITGGGTGLTYAPDANYCTVADAVDAFTYTLTGGSSATVEMTVTCVNDAPVADDETVAGAIGNTTLIGDDPSDAAPTVGHTSRTVSADVLDGDTDVDGPGPLVVTAGTFPTNDGGSVVVEADGDFVYTPAAGTSCTDTSDYFDYTVSDGGASPASDTGRVTITLSDCVWYVSNSAAGNAGTSSAPFDTLAQAQTASAANHTIYLFDGDDTATGYAAGLDLKAGQRLIGEAADLTVGGVQLRSGVPAARPTLTDVGNDVVTLSTGNTVRGVQIDPQGAGGVFGGSSAANGTLHDVRIVDAGTAGTQPGLELDATTGTWDVSGLTVQNGGSSAATGIRLNNAGTVNLGTGVGANTVTTTGAKALDLTGTSLGTGSVLGVVTVTGSSTGAVSLVDTTGTVSLGDGSGGDLSLTGLTGATAAFRLSNAGNVTVPAAGTSDVSINGGPAIDVTGTSGASLSFDDVDSANSTGDGINLAGLGTGTFRAGTGSTITDVASGGVAFDLDGGSGAVTYDGTITSDVGRLLRVVNTTAGLKDFNGAITDNGDGDGGELGVLLSGNSGATVRLDGGLVVRTTTQPAFTATGGGTVAVLDPSGTNALQATTGTPLTVTSTTIHDDDLTFRRVASNGAANGIVLSSTANANGRLVVAGTGGSCTVANPTCTGGAVLASTGAGVSLTNVPGGASLTAMRVANGGDDGIRATTVNDVDLVDSLVTGNGNSHAGGAEERGLDYLDVTGTPQILRTVVSGSADSNAHIRNTTGTTTLGVDSSTFTDSKNNAGLRLLGQQGSTMTATVQRSVFSLNADPGFSMQADAATSVTQTLTFDDNDVSGGSANAVPGRPQVSINAGGGSVVRASVTNNDIKSASGAEVILNTLASHTGTFDARVVGNDINDAQPGALDPQVDGGSSIWGWAHGSGTTRMEIRNNLIANWGGRALELSHNDGSGDADYTVAGNTFGASDATPNVFEGIYVFAGGLTTDASDVCVDFEDNAGLQQLGNQGLPDIAMDRFFSGVLRFADVNAASVAAVQTSLAGKNPTSPALSFDTYGNQPTATTATTCAQAVGTP
jgi:hypothetical protein